MKKIIEIFKQYKQKKDNFISLGDYYKEKMPEVWEKHTDREKKVLMKMKIDKKLIED